MNEKNNTSATHQLRKSFIKYVPLNMLGMLALSCYIIADTFFVANGVGADGMTALNLVLPLYSFISAIGLLFGMGGATKFSIYKGSQNMPGANRVFSRTMLCAVGTGIFIMLIGVVFTKEICTLLGADEIIVPFATEYLKTIMFFAVAFIVNNALVCFVRNDGNPKLSMLAMLLGSLSNVVLDYIFIFSLQMGMFGAAIATCLAPIIGIITLSFHWITKRNCLHFMKCKMNFPQMVKVVSIGFSSFVAEFSSGVVILIFNFVIMKLAGNTGVAAFGIIANINLFALSIFAGISEGVQPLISHSYGARDLFALKKVYIWAVELSIIFGVCLYVLLFVFAEPIASLFNRDHDMVLMQFAVAGIRQYFPMLFLSGFNIVTASLFASMSKVVASFLISVARGFVCIAILVFALSTMFGMAGVWISLPATEIITFLLSAVLLLQLRHNTAKTHLQPVNKA